MFSLYTKGLSSKLHHNINFIRQFSIFPQENLNLWNDLYSSTQQQINKTLKCNNNISAEMRKDLETNYSQYRLSINVISRI